MLHKKTGTLLSRIISGTAAEIIMILGYFLFEGFMYGFISSAVNIPANAVQGIAGLIIALILMKAFEKSNLSLN